MSQGLWLTFSRPTGSIKKKEPYSGLRLEGEVMREVAGLKTSNKKEAEQLVRTESVELDNHFAELRRQQQEAPKTKISGVEIARIVAKATATRMKADEDLKWFEEAEVNGSAAVARGRFEGLQLMIDDWLIGERQGRCLSVFFRHHKQ
jgi:hypothetical protein